MSHFSRLWRETETYWDFFSDVIHMDFEHQTLHSPYFPILLENPFNIYIKRYFTVALNWHICRPSEVSKIKHKK